MAVDRDNPHLSPFLRWSILTAVVVLIGGGLGLFFFNDLLRPRWPWTIPPYHSRFLAAIYLAQLVGGLIIGLTNRWAPVRIALPLASIFTLGVSLVSLVYMNRFSSEHPLVTGLWFLLYVGYTAVLGYFLWRYRHLPPAAAVPTPVEWRRYLLGQASIMGLYVLALLILPVAAAAFWPWAVDEFHGRLYLSALLSLVAGPWLLQRAAAAIEWFTLGVMQAVFGSMAIAGLLVTDLQLGRVNWTAAGTWLWLLANLLLALGGGAMIWRSYYLRSRQASQARVGAVNTSSTIV